MDDTDKRQRHSDNLPGVLTFDAKGYGRNRGGVPCDTDVFGVSVDTSTSDKNRNSGPINTGVRSPSDCRASFRVSDFRC